MADKFQFVYEDPTNTNQITGSTPYGLYDGDDTFVEESLQICKFVSRRLGHPVMQLEFGSGSIYSMFEEAISEYSQLINQYNMKNWLWDQYGNENRTSGSMTTGSFNPITPNMGTSVHLSETYGSAVGVGGNTNLFTGSITLTGSQQVYDLPNDATFEGSNHNTQTLEIQRVFNYGPAAITRFYDPFAGSFEQRSMLDNLGMGNVSPAVSFVLRPLSHDLVRAQAIESNDKIRKSAYSFELINNKLRVFPRPKSGDAGDKIWFNYYVKSEKNSTTRSYTQGKVSDPSNAPYTNITYSDINAPGRQWIRKYTLALSKELLGIIRSKYASMPLPNGEVSLDGEALKAEGREEKTQLLDEMNTFLESVSLKERAVAEQEVADANQQVLSKAPLGIYIG
tara:strand:+ start:2113 stop:3297 length:1185 start_codon:yes stop_codon:yes gene_type:complete